MRNYFEPKVGQVCQMIYTTADVPQWINCLPKAASSHGIAVSVDIINEGEKTLWFDNFQINRVIVFRPIVPECKQWAAKDSDDIYEMVCLSNVVTAKPGFPLTVIFKNKDDEIFSMNAADFLDSYEPKFSDQTTSEQSEQCEIIDSQDEPVVVSGELK
ncbi:TPA: hypothetical protein ACHOZC_003465 [Raoultella ornithinolytica]